MRIGVARDVLEHGISDEVRAGIETSIAALKDAGHEIVDVALPHAKYAISIYYLIAPAEASSNLARFDGIRYGLRAPGNSLIDSYEKTRSQGFGPEVQRRIMLGTYALSSGYYDAYYIKAQKARTRIREDFIEAFSRCDVILTPTTPTTAFSLGEKTSDPMAMYAADICTLPASLAGVPALSTPCGLGDSGLPIGVQLTAFDLQESKLFQVARDIEARCAIGAPARFEVTS